MTAASDSFTEPDGSAPAAAPTPAPGRRERNRRAKERAYLDAAMDIAVEVGLRGLTMTKLAESVDAAVGTVYTYFPSKGALIAELQRESVERLLASFAVVRDRSEALLAENPDPRGVAVARLATFGGFWVAAVETFPQEAAMLHGLLSETEVMIPPEERYRVMPTALALLGEGNQAVQQAMEVGVIRTSNPVDVVIRWAAAMTGVLLTSNVGDASPVPVDGSYLAGQLQRDLLLGWGAPVELVDLADVHVAALARGGPLAPRADPGV